MIKSRDYWLLIVGIGIAETGMWFGFIGNLEFLQQLLESSFLQSIILLTTALFGIFCAPIAARLLDKTDKKKVLIYCSITRIVAILIMFLALEIESIWLMIAYNALIGAVTSFIYPAIDSLLPKILPEEKLVEANGIYTNVVTLSRIAGTGLAGLMLLHINLFSLYAIAMVASIVILVLTFFIKHKEKIEKSIDSIGTKEGGKFNDVKVVLGILKENPLVKVNVFLGIVPYFFLAGFNLVIIEISKIQDDPSIKGILYTVEGIFAMIAALLVKYISKGKNIVPKIIMITSTIGLIQIFLTFAEYKFVAIAVFAIFGICAGLFFPLNVTFYQTNVPKEVHGRFFSYKRMLDRTVYQVLLLTTGFFLDYIGFDLMVIIFGVSGIAIASSISLYYFKKINLQKGKDLRETVK